MPTAISNFSDAVMTSMTGAMAMLFAALPKIIGFAIILVVGWFIASLVGKAINALLHAIRFNHFADRSGLSDFIRKTGEQNDASGILAAIAKWFIRLIALVVAFDALGLPAVSDVLRSLLLWLPNLVVAVVALVIGGIAANALGDVVRAAAAEGGLDRPNFLARVAEVAIWAFAIVVAVNQIGIATELVNTLFMATMGALALAFGLAFGLGSRDTAAAIVHRWYSEGKEKAPQLSHAADVAAEKTARTASSMTASAPSSYPGSERRTGPEERRHGRVRVA